MAKTILQRILEKTKMSTGSECIVWTAGTSGYASRGLYGKIKVDGKDKGSHRVLYELIFGEIQHGLHLDHLCRNTLCVNPFHLEPVTIRENTIRGADAKETCKHGHKWIPENHKISIDGHRFCIPCRKAASKKQQQKKKLSYLN